MALKIWESVRFAGRAEDIAEGYISILFMIPYICLCRNRVRIKLYLFRCFAKAMEVAKHRHYGSVFFGKTFRDKKLLRLKGQGLRMSFTHNLLTHNP